MPMRRRAQKGLGEGSLNYTTSVNLTEALRRCRFSLSCRWSLRPGIRNAWQLVLWIAQQSPPSSGLSDMP